MLNLWQKQQNKKILGAEFCTDGICYVLVEFGRDIKVLYKGMEPPAFSFDGVALAVPDIEEYSLPIRNVSEKEMLTLLHNEMQVSWGRNPEEYQVAWYRLENNDVGIGLLAKKLFEENLFYAEKLGTELLALVPVRRNNASGEENVYGPALHAAYVAAGKENDINFAVLLQNSKKRQLRCRRYLTVAKGIVTVAGIVFAGLTALYGFSCHRVYSLNKILTGMRNIQEQYDLYLTKSGQIKYLQGLKKQILGSNKFRAELVEQILDSMPEYNNEINILRTQQIREKGKLSELVMLEGRVNGIRQLKKFVENLNREDRFSKVIIGTSKSNNDGSLDYTINISLGEGANAK